MVGRGWSALKNYLYDKGIIKSVKAEAFTISIGNLTWGGTGKTSLVQELATYFLTLGYRVAIISRGYGRNSNGAMLISDGTSIRHGWRESGDEAYLLAEMLPKAIVAVAERRAGALPLIQPMAPEVILLDDAFQHRQISRDLDLVLLDASEDISRQRVIPFGKLREGPNSLGRADAVILMHSIQMNWNTSEWVKQNITAPVFHANYSIDQQPGINGKKIVAFCAIGAPRHFFELLQAQGAQIVATKTFRDHHRFTEPEIEALAEEARKLQADFLVTTAKDAIRIDPEWINPFLKTVRVKLQIMEESNFYEFLMDRFRQSAIRPHIS